MSDSETNDTPPQPTPGTPPPPPPPPTPATPPTGDPTVATPSIPGEPEPFFITEQTPVPNPEPIVPPTAQMPITPPSGVPLTGDVPPTAVITPGGPGGPYGPGPGGPMEPDGPDEPWYKKPGPLIVIGIVILLLIALLAWLLSGGSGNDDDAIVDTTLETTTTSEAPLETTTLPDTILPPETTLAVVPTLPPETTEAPTTEAPTTLPPETTEATTTSTTTSTTVPEIVPEPGDTLWNVIENTDVLDAYQALIERADLRDTFDDAEATLTVFAPTNDAIEAALGDDAGTIDSEVLRNLVLAGVHDGGAVSQSNLVTMSTISVMFAGPQHIDGGAVPPRVGGAAIMQQVAPVGNGVLYLVDAMLQPVAD